MSNMCACDFPFDGTKIIIENSKPLIGPTGATGATGPTGTCEHGCCNKTKMEFKMICFSFYSCPNAEA